MVPFPSPRTFAARAAGSSRRRRLVAMAALVMAMLTALVSLAPAASAHHSEITATAGCAGQVEWTASAWETADEARRTNHDVKVWYEVADGPDAGDTAEVGRSHFGADNDFSFSGAFPWPSAVATTVIVKVQEQVAWGPNETSGGISSARTTSVTKPSGCAGLPEVTGDVACADGDGDVRIELTNTGGGAAVVFAVTDPRDGSTTTKTVAVGGTDSVVLAGLDDGPLTIPVTADGAPFDQALTVACDRPGLPQTSGEVRCANGDGDVKVNLANEGGDEPVVFVVTDPRDGSTVTRTVDVGASASITFPGLDDGTVTIAITADGEPFDQVLTVACDRPGVADVGATLECSAGDGELTITLTNTGGDKPVLFLVSDPRNGETTIRTVAVGATATVLLAGLDDGPFTVAIIADGVAHDRSTNVACDRPGVPSVTAGVECTEGDGALTVTIRNTGGDDAVTFVVTDPRTGTTTTRVVAVGTTDFVMLDGVPDGTVTIPVTADGEQLDQIVAVDCDVPGVPSVKARATCRAFDGVVVVALANTGGTEPIVFAVTAPGTATRTVTVAPGGSSSVSIPDLPDGPITISVTADSASLPQTVQVDCDHPGTPEASSRVACAAQGGRLVLSLVNADPEGTAEPIVFVVTDPRTGKPSTFTVPAGTSTKVILGGFPDGEVSVLVTADGVELPEMSAAVECRVPDVTEVVMSCQRDGAVVRLTNGGSTPVEVTVRKDEEIVTTVTVAKDQPAEVVVPMTEDEEAVVEVSSEGEVLRSDTLTFDCVEAVSTTASTIVGTTVTTTDPGPSITRLPSDTDPSVLGVTVSTVRTPTDPATEPTAVTPVPVLTGNLPLTGSSSLGLAVAGALLVLAGWILVGTARPVGRRR